MTVGYSAFYPLPESFFEDPEAAGEQPVGNGPFQADEPFQPGVGITLTRYDEYAGEDKAEVSAVEYRVYTDVKTAYTDVVAGNLDVLRRIPADASATAPAEFGERYLEDTSSSFTYLGLPLYDKRFADKRVRQALSMGIDREAIATAIFNGTRTPATSVIAPDDRRRPRGRLRLLPSRRRRANALLDVARFDRSKPIEPWFNADAGLDAWMEAVGNQLRQNLGVNYVLPEPAELPRAAVLDQRTAPGGANLSFYSNPVFDQLVGEGDQAQSNAEAIAKYNQAEDVLLEDMPIIPMFFQVEQSLFSEHVSDVTVDIFGRIDAAEVTVND